MLPDGASPLVGQTTSAARCGQASIDPMLRSCPCHLAAAEVERLREAVNYALPIIRDAYEDLDDDGRQTTASAVHTAHERLVAALGAEGHKDEPA